ELQVSRLALKRDVLEEREVPVVCARIAEDVFRGVPEIASSRAREYCRIDPLHEAAGRRRLFTVRKIRIALDDDTRAITAAGEVGSAVNQRQADAAGRAAGDRRDARQLPVVEDGLDHRVVP